MMQVSIEVRGIQQTLGELKAWERRKIAAARKQIDKTALNIAREAKKGAPVDTGRLRSSIHVNRPGKSAHRYTVRGRSYSDPVAGYSGSLTRAVGTNVKYAAAHEFGTRHMAARPFLGPAYQQEIPNYLRAMKKIFKD